MLTEAPSVGDDGRAVGGRGEQEIFLPSFQFCHEPKTALKQ